MKLNDILELNGKEYTVELNRESVLRIEQYTDTMGIAKLIEQPIIEDKRNKEIESGENPFEGAIEEEELEKIAKERGDAIKETVVRAFWIWLYPVEKLDIKEVRELLEPYIEDETKAQYISDKYAEFMKKSVEVREKFLEEQKNLKALTK